MSPFDEKVYERIAIGKQIVFAIYSVNRNGEECSFERLVKECFTLFPKTFGFYRYPEWPDSLRLDRALRTLREKGWITGSAKTVFSLTRFGEQVAREVERTLAGRRMPPGPIRRLAKGQEAKLINELKQNQVYARFDQDRDDFSISETELRRMLHCTLETPLRVVKQSLQYCKNLAEECKEEELWQFLSTCEDKLGLKSRY